MARTSVEAEPSMIRCHLCRMRRGDLVESGAEPDLWWCPPDDRVECNFRARRRLGLPLVVALEWKARDLEQNASPFLANADATRARVAAILAGGLPQRTLEYRAHLTSTKWESFRDDQIQLAGYRCEADDCGSFGRDHQVHHLSYDHLGQERPWEVVVLCQMCHLAWDEARRDFYRQKKGFRKTAEPAAIYRDLLTPEVALTIRKRSERTREIQGAQ